MPQSDSWSCVKTTVKYHHAYVNLKMLLDDLHLQHFSGNQTPSVKLALYLYKKIVGDYNFIQKSSSLAFT